jgi:hypothetical protein
MNPPQFTVRSLLLATVVVALCLAIAPKDPPLEGLAFAGCLAGFVLGMIGVVSIEFRSEHTLTVVLLWLVSFWFAAAYLVMVWLRTR